MIEAAGNKPKRIEEYVGRVNTCTPEVSVARMLSPPGWKEPGQQPDFTEFTLVLRGMLTVEHEDGDLDVFACQAAIAHADEWVRYSSPGPEQTEYVAVCLPTFSLQTAHHDAE